MATDNGSQVVSVKFFDAIDSAVVNKIGLDVRKTGIYSGGYLYDLVGNTSVSLSPLTCEISDGTHQVRVITTDPVTAIDISGSKSYVVLRWNYTGVAADDYMELKGVAVGDLDSNDLIVGVATTSISYTLRTNPQVMDLFLKVEPIDALAGPAGLYVHVRAGRVNYGLANYDIVDQVSPLMTAPGSGTTIYAVQVNTAGAVIVTPNTTTPPSYAGLITLAEITIPSGTSALSASSIKDVRNFIGVAYSNPVLLTGNQTVAGVKTFISSPIVPTPTTDYQSSTKKYADDGLALKQNNINYVKVCYALADNAAGLDYTSNVWTVVALNTERSDAGSVCTLAANRVTLTAGTYQIQAHVATWGTDNGQLRLRNITDGTTIIVGIKSDGVGDNNDGTRYLSGEFTIGSGKALELQFYGISSGKIGPETAHTFGETCEIAIAELWKVG